MDENKTPVRVLCVFALLDRGGAESMCMELYRHIDKRKIQFDFVKHTSNKGVFEDEILSLGGKIYEAPRYKVYNHFSYCKWWKNHLKQHPEHKIIHGHFFTISSIYFKAAKKFSRITIAHSHMSNFKSKGLIKKIKLRFIENIKQYSDYSFACSENAGNWMFPNIDFKILNNAIDTKIFRFSSKKHTAIKKELELENCLVVGTVGNIAFLKNPYEIIEIIKACKEKIANFRFLWIGGGNLWEEIHQKVIDERLNDWVIMTGVRTDICDMLHAMDVFILPSLSEGLPVSVVEAQATGLPCFISDVITSEVVLTENCHKLPLGNPAKWATEISKIDVSARRDMKKEIIDAGYDIKSTSKWLQDFYISILKH